MRDLSDYKNGLHMELERHWSKKTGTLFDEENILNSAISDNKILKEATSLNLKFGITFNNKVPNTNAKDIRDEVVLLYRASFAIVSIIASLITYKYKPNVQNSGTYDILFSKDKQGIDLFEELDIVVMHDAVLNVAIIWKDKWMKFE